MLVQYSAAVRGYGVSPSLPCATTTPASSRTSTRSAASAMPAEDFAPTSIANLAPVTTGDGIDQTARLVAWGTILVGIGDGHFVMPDARNVMRAEHHTPVVFAHVGPALRA